MIKSLISEIVNDSLKLSQALTKAKTIAFKISNDSLKEWVSKELEGYKNGDLIPSYRKIYSPITLTVEFPFGREQSFPVILPDNLEEKIGDAINFYEFHEPISIIEENVENFQTSKAYFEIPRGQVNLLTKLYKSQLELNDGVLTKGYREVGKVQLLKIIELTKQKLLDTLMEVDSRFPNIVSEKTISKEKSNLIQNIVTNNIYGNAGPMNVLVGRNIKQEGNTFILSSVDFKQLEKLGVNEELINEIKQIISENHSDKDKLKSKLLTWIGNVSASLAATGLYENIPAIVELVKKLF